VPNHLKPLWKTLEILSVIATLISFIDAYALHGQLALALRLPAEVPTGLFLSLLFMFVAAVFILWNRFSKNVVDLVAVQFELKDVRSQLNAKQAELERSSKITNEALEKAKLLERKLAAFDPADRRMAGLRKQIIAVLATQARNETQIRDALRIRFDDAESFRLLQEVLGDLVSEGVIQRQRMSSDFELRSQTT